MKKYIIQENRPSIAIYPVTTKTLESFLQKKGAPFKRWVEASSFKAKPGSFCTIPDKDGGIECAIAGIGETPNIWSFAGLSSSLPSATYHIEGKYTPAQHEQFALGWQLGTYQFTRYKKSKKHFATLNLPKQCDFEAVEWLAESIFLIRDMINTPTNDMVPADLAEQCEKVARECGATCKIIEGKDLLKAHYPAIYTVGKASENTPCLIDLRWGKKHAPRVTLVGKGVCFDSGGLDIKPSSAMKLMKKDMAGAATVLALGRMIMLSKLPVQLRVLIPAVENSISGNAYRPLDIISTRKGLTVEVGNTDAEGRLILCDALTEADSEKPDLLVDFATLTGAARVALGTDLPAYFTDDDALAKALDKHSRETHDFLWRLPLWQPYRDMLNTAVADINSAPDGGYGGAITAALYLKEFVENTKSWLHIDMMAWNLSNKPGRPVGGEAMGLRTLFTLIKNRYA